MSCPNCNRSFRAGGNGLAFHLTWCKPAQPAAIDDAWQALTPAQRDAIRHPAPAPTLAVVPVVARAPRGRLLTRKARRARLSALLARPAPVLKAQKAPAVKGPKMPASTGKHARCVAHIPMVRTAPGVAYACFDVAPDADAIAERAAFLDVIDGAWNVAHVAYMSRLAPEPTDAARALSDTYSAGLYVSRMATDEEREAQREMRASEMAEWTGGPVRCPVDNYPSFCAHSRHGFADEAGLSAHIAYRHSGEELPARSPYALPDPIAA